MAYAQAKGLSVEFLEGLDLQDDSYNGKPAVRIPYFDRDGSDLPLKLRPTLTGPRHALPLARPTVLVPYGLWRLDDAIRAGYVLVVRAGPTATPCGMPVCPRSGSPVPTPGTRTGPPISTASTGSIVLIEPDRGGGAVMEWLSESRIRERAYTVTLGHLAGVPR